METLVLQRLRKLEELREEGINPFPNDFKIRYTTKEVREKFEDMSEERLKEIKEEFSLAGRVMAIRDFGKAVFLQLQDGEGKIQGYLQRDVIGKEGFELFKRFDLGDFIGITGSIFRTKTKELTIFAKKLRLLAKSLRPLPEKWHGLKDTEARYRQRYLDLIVNPQIKETFYRRALIIHMIREFLNQRSFLEIETPVMQALPGGALAQPFKTYHNALNTELYLRIAPELYLKRLVIGGIERVYEIGKSFRNEGISTLHNPEFTMLEFYQAYATYEDLMALTEEMLCLIAEKLFDSLNFSYLGKDIDLSLPWRRLDLKEAISLYGKVEMEVIEDEAKVREYAKKIEIEEDGLSLGEVLLCIFEKVAEPQIIQPTFIIHYPTEVSPLARQRDLNPEEVERFELYIAGKEIANAFSELNDPLEQRKRFEVQSKEKGDHIIDEDFLTALEYGMPPTAGEGIGIDRLVMILTNSASVRDVVPFPLLKPK